MTVLLTVDEILATRVAIDPIFLNSPLMRHPALDQALGCAVTMKVETLNPIRSFKERGTESVLASLEPRPIAVVTASSGNFGQGIAWATRRRGIAATIFAPANANPLKVESMRRLGAVVHLVESGRDESEAAREAAMGKDPSRDTCHSVGRSAIDRRPGPEGPSRKQPLRDRVSDQCVQS
jgi:threonine dehydratase